MPSSCCPHPGGQHVIYRLSVRHPRMTRHLLIICTALHKASRVFVDLGVHRGCAPAAQNVLNFMHLFQKIWPFCKICTPPDDWRPLLRGFMDPPMQRDSRFPTMGAPIPSLSNSFIYIRIREGGFTERLNNLEICFHL